MVVPRGGGKGYVFVKGRLGRVVWYKENVFIIKCIARRQQVTLLLLVLQLLLVLLPVP